MENRGFFEIDKSGKLIVDKKEARAVPEYKAILIRDKGSEGDSEGRNKFFAFKEFMYIYLVADPKSVVRDLPIKDRKVKAIEMAELPDTWKEDHVIKNGIDKYEEGLLLSGTEFAYYNASRSMYNLGKDLEFLNMSNDILRNKIKSLREELDSGDLTPDVIEDKEYNMTKAIEALSKNSQEVVKLSNLLPKSYSALEELYEKMKKEQQTNNRLYGGGNLGNREE